jgi:hypothetical protein
MMKYLDFYAVVGRLTNNSPASKRRPIDSLGFETSFNSESCGGC